MANIGLTNIYVGLKNQDQTTIVGADGLSETGVFAIDTDSSNGNLGSRSANITGLSGTVSKVMGNNVPVAVSHAKGAPSVAIDSNAIQTEAKNKMLGRVKQGGGWVDGTGTTYSGMIIESMSPTTFKPVYYAFGFGVMTESSQNVQTNTDTAETREDDNLTFTALNYDKFNKNPYKVYDSSDKDFKLQDMFDEVFPNNTYDAETGEAKNGASETTPHEVTNSGGQTSTTSGSDTQA